MLSAQQLKELTKTNSTTKMNRQLLTASANNASSTQLVTLKPFVADVSAGLSVSVVGYSFEALKKALQSEQFGPSGLIARTWKAPHPEGLQNEKFFPKSMRVWKEIRTGAMNGYKFYRGFPVFALNIIPTTYFQLTAKKIADKLLGENPSLSHRLSANVASGVMGAAFGTIVENCIVRQQRMKSGLMPAVRDMVANGGVARLWKSYPQIAVRDGIFTFCMFGNDQLDAHLKDSGWSNMARGLTSVSIGIGGTVVTHPFDTVGTLRQETHQKISATDVAKQLYKSDGVAGFYRGVGPRAVLFMSFAYLIPKVQRWTTNALDQMEPCFAEGAVKQASATSSSKNTNNVATPSVSEPTYTMPRPQ